MYKPKRDKESHDQISPQLHVFHRLCVSGSQVISIAQELESSLALGFLLIFCHICWSFGGIGLHRRLRGDQLAHGLAKLFDFCCCWSGNQLDFQVILEHGLNLASHIVVFVLVFHSRGLHQIANVPLNGITRWTFTRRLHRAPGLLFFMLLQEFKSSSCLAQIFRIPHGYQFLHQRIRQSLNFFEFDLQTKRGKEKLKTNALFTHCKLSRLVTSTLWTFYLLHIWNLFPNSAKFWTLHVTS